LLTRVGNKEQEDAATSLDAALIRLQNEHDDIDIDAVLIDFDWKAGNDAAALEGRLLNELVALEAVRPIQKSVDGAG
jgi:hypothetical protein